MFISHFNVSFLIYDHFQVTNMGIVVEVLRELENFHMSREGLEVNLVYLSYFAVFIIRS